MNVSKLLASTFAAASVVGAIGLAYAQTTPNDTTAQARPADQTLQGQPMDSTERMKQPQNTLPATDATAQPNVQATQPLDSTQRPQSQTMPQGSPDGGTPYTPATATDNTTTPAPGNMNRSDAMPPSTATPPTGSGMSADTERAPQADRN